MLECRGHTLAVLQALRGVESDHSRPTLCPLSCLAAYCSALSAVADVMPAHRLVASGGFRGPLAATASFCPAAVCSS